MATNISTCSLFPVQIDCLTIPNNSKITHHRRVIHSLDTADNAEKINNKQQQKREVVRTSQVFFLRWSQMVKQNECTVGRKT